MNEIIFDNQDTTKSDRAIHTPSSFARKHLNFVQEAGTLVSLKAHSCIRENLDSYLIFFCQEGEGVVVTGGKTYEVKAGDVVFLDCHKHYEHRSSDEHPWKISWIHFKGSTIEALYTLFNEGNKTSPLFTPANGLAEFESLFEKIKSLLEVRGVMAEIESSQLLVQLVKLSMEEVVDENELTVDNEGEMENDDYASLRESVNEHSEEPGLLRILSIQYGLKEDKLSELFEKKYGIELNAYIMNRRFNKAKELLRFTIKPIDEIVVESGIKDPDLFKKMFLDNEEMSPEDYRKKWAQWIKS